MTGSGDGSQPRQSCDNCRFRKVRCNRRQPCNQCQTGRLRCEYLHSIRRKGPKRGQGRRQSQLRHGLADVGTSPFQILAMNVARDDAVSNSGSSEGHTQIPQQTTPSTQSVTQSEDDVFTLASSAHHGLSGTACEPSGGALSMSLIAHIQLFLKILFPIMPVVAGDELLADAARLEELAPSRYALVLALCAATRMQLRMDDGAISQGLQEEVDIPAEPELTGEILVRLAEASLRQYTAIEDESLDSLLASFFLFASYGNLNKPRHAWFYLNQSISLAQLLDMTHEAGYHQLPVIEQEKRRRVFWLLFVTERTYALQTRRQVMLRSSIMKPRVIDSDCPVVMNDFVNHIRIFETLPWSLYEWHNSEDGSPVEKLSLVHTVNDKLCTIHADQSVIPSQRFDTLITQQWLRVSMWRLAVGENPSSAGFNFGRVLLPRDLPVEAGKIIMSALGSISPKLKDCHGIGMEQKLFNIGISLADCATLSDRNAPSSFEIGPRDMLCAVIHALYNARGSPSYLLPPLLKHSEKILRLTDPKPFVNIPLEIPQHMHSVARNAMIEHVSTSTEDEDQANPLRWLSSDDFGLLDIGMLSSTWDDSELSGGQVDSGIGLLLEE